MRINNALNVILQKCLVLEKIPRETLFARSVVLVTYDWYKGVSL